ncbi:MAG TPA: 23S rRNA (pseudouridine(1915)-N(3))-methyltransferase RlmH [Thermoanaerobaculia bacterium]|nr:23S rRNA (pseudouridine(1915)-N(3))-methyltransferase RlmH [Thermoanaerobaculia bacterium]
MKFRFIWIRSHAEPDYREALDRYVKRISHFYPVELIELPPERGRNAKDEASALRADSARLLGAIPPKGFVVVLDERGELISSLKFARWLERMTMEHPHGVSFVMGGDVGFTDEVRKRGDRILALSPMTLPHQLARVMLLEQVYRACTVIRNIPYHK